MATKAEKHAACMTIYDLVSDGVLTVGQMTRLALAADMLPDLIASLRRRIDDQQKRSDEPWPVSVVTPAA